MERLQIIYKNGTSVEINACNGSYKQIMAELKRDKRADYAMPPERSIYQYCISLKDIVGVFKINKPKQNDMGFK